MRSTTKNTDTTVPKETQQKDESSWIFRFFSTHPEEQKFWAQFENDASQKKQHTIQNALSFQREPEKWKKIQIVSLDHHINFDLIDTSILHQHKWVVERRGFSTSIDVPADKYDSIIESLKSDKSIYQINGQWRQSWRYPGLENNHVRFPNTF